MLAGPGETEKSGAVSLAGQSCESLRRTHARPTSPAQPNVPATHNHHTNPDKRLHVLTGLAWSCPSGMPTASGASALNASKCAYEENMRM